MQLPDLTEPYQREDDVVERRGGQQEEQHSEEQRPQEQLVHVVRGAVDALPQHVPLLSTKETPERRERVHLQTVQPVHKKKRTSGLTKET